MGDLDRALGAYERALIINSQSWGALTMAAHVCRCKEDYGRVSPVSILFLSLAPRNLGSCLSKFPSLHLQSGRASARARLRWLVLCAAPQPWEEADGHE